MKRLGELPLVAALCAACWAAGSWVGPRPDSSPPQVPRGHDAGEITGPGRRSGFRRGLRTHGGGLWHRRREIGAAQQEALETLQSLSYVAGSQPPSPQAGVTGHDPRRAAEGYDLYSSAHTPQAFRIDMGGRVLHQWQMDRDAVWPELAGIDENKARRHFRRVNLFENGDLLAIYEYTGIIKLDRNSTLLWAHQGWNHHDLDADEEGRICVLGRDFDAEGRPPLRARGKPRPKRKLAGNWVYDENITVLSPQGKLLRKISLIDAIENSRFAPLLDAARAPARREPVDLLHPNILEILGEECDEPPPPFKEGNILTSFRNILPIAIVARRVRVRMQSCRTCRPPC